MSASLSHVNGYVHDAFVVTVERPFKPEDIVLGVFTFLPWVRTGIASAVQDPATGIRAGVTVTVPVQGDGVPDRPVVKALSVRGPGDVLSFDERQVVRRYPLPGTTNAEASFLAHVEFDRPDFPWLFSPQAPIGDRLRPWIALVVVHARLGQLIPGSGGLPPRLRTVLGELPRPDTDGGASWAHAQILGGRQDSTTASVEDRLSAQYGLANLSRLLCPQPLEANESYLACVVPAYDAGRVAGLGQHQPGTLGPAWTPATDGSDQATEIELPCYHSWSFQTGPAGDFKSLAKKLIAEPAPWRLGRRILDASRPGGGLADLDPSASGRLQVMRGPLVSPADAPSETAAWPAAKTESLRELLNRPDALAADPAAPSAEQRPRIGPTIYAQHHAGVTRVDPEHDSDWLGELNLHPTNRVAAGLGTRVVQMDQEELMQSAWAQVGSVEEVNRQLRRAQLGRFAGASLHKRHLTPLAYGDLVQATRRVHGRVSVDGALTVHAEIAQSAVADAAVTDTFRRVTRPLGPLARYAVGGGRAELAGLVARAGAPRDFQRPYGDLDGVTGVSERAARALDPVIVAGVLKLGEMSAADVAIELVAKGRELVEEAPLPDQLAAHGIALSEPLNPAGLGADAVYTALADSLPHEPHDRARAMSYLDLLTGLAQSGLPVSAKADELAQELQRSIRLGAPYQWPAQDSQGSRLLTSLEPPEPIAPGATAAGLAAIGSELVAEAWDGTPDRPALSLSHPTLLGQLNPALTVTRRIKARIGSFPAWLPGDWLDDGLVQPIMAAPVFTRAMYEALADYDRNWLIPGLGEIEEPDFVTLLQTNAEFIEAFLVGLSHEFARELLWRGYPTDQRGTYFRRFWNDEEDELVPDIHRFAKTGLGTHISAKLLDRLVLLVHGELIRRYPDAIVLGLRAHDWSKPPVFADAAADPSSMAKILFHAHLAPDIVLVGFDLTSTDVEAEPWWFLVAEHPTAPRFGVPDATLPTPAPDAASVAHRLLRDPVRAAFQGKQLLEPISGPH